MWVEQEGARLVMSDKTLTLTGDGDSKSEIVVPILVDGKTVAIIDIDCAVAKGFDEVDRKSLEALAILLGKACDW
jgi:L-methionine (R)-S-oxide reductase